jgi:hypothetical protein
MATEARLRKIDELSAILGLAAPAERRRHGREPVEIDARIVSDDLWCAIDCRIVNRSPTGAKLALPWPTIMLPERFDLVIPAETRTLTVRRVWHHGKEAGVEFLSSTSH